MRCVCACELSGTHPGERRDERHKDSRRDRKHKKGNKHRDDGRHHDRGRDDGDEGEVKKKAPMSSISKLIYQMTPYLFCVYLAARGDARLVRWSSHPSIHLLNWSFHPSHSPVNCSIATHRPVPPHVECKPTPPTRLRRVVRFTHRASLAAIKNETMD